MEIRKVLGREPEEALFSRRVPSDIPLHGPACRALILVALLMTCLPGCRLGYVIQAGAGQIELLMGSRPLDDLRKEQALSPQDLETALLIQDVRRFGEEDLGLKKTRNYSTVYVKGERDPIYALMGAPRDRLELKTWWFPVVGRVPYLGFFDLEKARREQAKLQEQGLDTYLRSAEAYSTLGWFRDPITPAMFRERPAALVETILHELTHVTLYVPGQGDFNEGLAVLAGLVGADLYCRTVWGPEHPESIYAAGAIHDQRLFSKYMDALFHALQDIYASEEPLARKLEERTRVFESAKRDFRALKDRFKTDRFSAFDAARFNNAYLLGVGLYHRRFSLFEGMYVRCGWDLAAVFSLCRRLAEAKGDTPMMDMVEQWVAAHPLQVADRGTPSSCTPCWGAYGTPTPPECSCQSHAPLAADVRSLHTRRMVASGRKGERSSL